MVKKILPALFGANVIAMALFWLRGSGDLLFGGDLAGIFIALGRGAGLLAELFILVELILVSRISLVEKAYGFDVLNRWHRWIGYGLLAGIVSHPLLLTIGYAKANGVSLSLQFNDFLLNMEDVAKAVAGLFLLIALAVVSLPIIRRRMRYGMWHGAHFFMYLAIGMVLGHQFATGDVSQGAGFYYWFVLNFSVFGALLGYRFIYPFILFRRHRFVVGRVVQETTNVFSVYIQGKDMESFLFESGQYVSVSFLTKGMWEPHPFSISQPFNGKEIRLSIKSVGDFTSRIKDLKPGTLVFLEGPFGKLTERSSAVNGSYLLIAGGIGITPLRALAETLSKGKKDVVLLYGNRTEADMVFKSEIEKLGINYRHIISEQEGSQYERGRIDEDKIRRYVPDILSRDVYICGPEKMMDALVETIKKIGVPKSQIHLEKFSY